MRNITLFILSLITISVSAQKFQKLATTPPMGWSSKNMTNINEKTIKNIVDNFIKLGLKDAGYEYILLDDEWMDRYRDMDGNLVANPKKFPQGLKELIKYIHAKGLKFGLYGCAGNRTHSGYPGSSGYEYQDALQYAKWGVDYLKYDWYDKTGELNVKKSYTTMRDALYKAGRPIVLNICERGYSEPWNWAGDIGHCWRVMDNINDCFDCIEIEIEGQNKELLWGILPTLNLYNNNLVRQFASSDRWNDLDILEVGNHGLSFYENQLHFALWAMLNSPLILSNNLQTINQVTLNIITNKHIIALNQDKLGVQGLKYASSNNMEIWIKPLINNKWAVCFFNHSNHSVEFTFDWEKQTFKDEIFDHKVTFSKNNVYTIVDLYKNIVMGNTLQIMKKRLDAHQCLVVQLYKSKNTYTNTKTILTPKKTSTTNMTSKERLRRMLIAKRRSDALQR